MQLLQIINTQVIRFVSAAPNGKLFPLRKFVLSLADRYNFLQVPLKVEEFDFGKGVTFLRGTFNDQRIDRFQLYNNGLLCDAPLDSGSAEAFVDDVLDWMKTDLDFVLTEQTEQPRAYTSQLEVIFESDLTKYMDQLSSVATAIDTALASYGQKSFPFSPSGIKLQADHSDDAMRPPDFIFERRVGHPHSSNLFYSACGLKTPDHIAVLEKLEAIANRSKAA